MHISRNCTSKDDKYSTALCATYKLEILHIKLCDELKSRKAVSLHYK